MILMQNPAESGRGHPRTAAEDEGLLIDEDQATQFLIADLQTAVDAVNRLVTVPLPQNQFYSLADFCFNIGDTEVAGQHCWRC
jgi:lysozyme